MSGLTAAQWRERQQKAKEGTRHLQLLSLLQKQHQEAMAQKHQAPSSSSSSSSIRLVHPAAQLVTSARAPCWYDARIRVATLQVASARAGMDTPAHTPQSREIELHLLK